MSGQIRMSPSELRDRAKTYGQSGRDIEDILSRLSQLQEQLRSEWEGQAFMRFDDQFEQLKPKVTEFANLMDQLTIDLKTANAVKSTIDNFLKTSDSKINKKWGIHTNIVGCFTKSHAVFCMAFSKHRKLMPKKVFI